MYNVVISKGHSVGVSPCISVDINRWLSIAKQLSLQSHSFPLFDSWSSFYFSLSHSSPPANPKCHLPNLWKIALALHVTPIYMHLDLFDRLFKSENLFQCQTSCFNMNLRERDFKSRVIMSVAFDPTLVAIMCYSV